MGCGISCTVYPGCCFRLQSQIALKGINDRGRNLVLYREDILEFLVISLGPEMEAVSRVNKLSGDAYFQARLSNAAFQNKACVQLSPYIDDVQVFTFELK